MLLRPGNAGSNTFADHLTVLGAAIRQIPARMRSRRQAKNLTAFERATGWRYSVIVTNIPAARGIGGVPGSHHAQFIDVLHRQHAVVEDGMRVGKSLGLRNLPSKSWLVAQYNSLSLSDWKGEQPPGPSNRFSWSQVSRPPSAANAA